MKTVTLLNVLTFWIIVLIAFRAESFFLGVALFLGWLFLEIIALMLYGKYLEHKEDKELYDKDGNPRF